MKLLLLLAALSMALADQGSLEGSVKDYRVKLCVLFKTGLWTTPDVISPLSPAAPGDRVLQVQVKGKLTRITTSTIFPRAVWVETKALGECVSPELQDKHFNKRKPVKEEPLELLDDKKPKNEKKKSSRFGDILSALNDDYAIDEPELEVKASKALKGKRATKHRKNTGEKKKEKTESKSESKKETKSTKKETKSKKKEKKETKSKKKKSESEKESKSQSNWEKDFEISSKKSKKEKGDDYGFDFGPKKVESYHKQIRGLRIELKRLRRKALKCPIESGNECFAKVHQRVKKVAKKLTKLCNRDTVCAGKLRARKLMAKMDQERKEKEKEEQEERRARVQARQAVARREASERKRKLAISAKKQAAELDSLKRNQERKKREEEERKKRREEAKKNRARQARRRARRERAEKRAEKREKRRKERKAAEEAEKEKSEVEEATELAKEHLDEQNEAADVAAEAHKEAQEREKQFLKEQAKAAQESAEQAREKEMSIQDLTRTTVSYYEAPTVDPNAPSPGLVFCAAANTAVFASPTSMEGSMMITGEENAFRIMEIVPGISHQFARVRDCMAYDFRMEYVRLDKLYKCPKLENTGRCKV